MFMYSSSIDPGIIRPRSLFVLSVILIYGSIAIYIYISPPSLSHRNKEFETIVFQFQHFGFFDRVVKHQKCNLKASKSTFESIKSNEQSNLMPYSLFFEKNINFPR